VIKTHPDFAGAHADHGIIFAKLRDYRQALSEIRQGIADCAGVGFAI
jgi:hypothetical protein